MEFLRQFKDRMSGDAIIERPQDPYRNAQLWFQLHKYESLFIGAYKPPETYSGSLYRIGLLKEVLEKGSVRSKTIEDRFRRKMGHIYAETYFPAFSIIEDYCNTGGITIPSIPGRLHIDHPLEKIGPKIPTLDDLPEDEKTQTNTMRNLYVFIFGQS